MLYFRPGSRVHFFVTVLATVGEFPHCSLRLFGDERVYKKLIAKMSEKQSYCNTETGQRLTVRLLSVSGKGENKTIRFYGPALPILEWIGAMDYYREIFGQRRFSGDRTHIDRNHRVAETVAIISKVGLETRPYMLPRLQDREFRAGFPEPVFYTAKEIKAAGRVEMNKAAFTRMVGAIFTNEGGYAIYNTRNSTMKWRGEGELKAKVALNQIAMMNAGVEEIDSAILLAESDSVALQTLNAANETKRREFRFDGIFHHIHYITMDRTGERMLKLLLIPSLKEKLLQLLFDDSDRSFGRGKFEYDAKLGDRYIYAFLDGDLAGLYRFRDGLDYFEEKGEVICYPHEAKFIREYLGELAEIKVIDMETIENELHIGKENDEI